MQRAQSASFARLGRRGRLPLREPHDERGLRFNFIVNTNAPLIASAAATTRSPPRNCPVEVRTSPMMYGPKNPPRFPTELMNAIPAAAVVADRSVVGIAQNGPIIEKTPTTATLTNATAIARDAVPPASPMAIAPARAGTAVCQRRSPERSELNPTNTIVIAAAT